MIQNKYASPIIGNLSEEKFNISCKTFLLKIYVITGWTIPGEPLINVLKDQFQKKLKEDYYMMNLDEIEYAFRQTGTDQEDWGKELNLNLIDKVLQPYLIKRLAASANEEKAKSKPEPMKILTDEEITNLRRGELEQAYQTIRSGRIPIIFDYYTELLVMDGFMKEGESIDEFFVLSLGKNRQNLYTR